LDSAERQRAFVAGRQSDGCVAFSFGLFKIFIGAGSVCCYWVVMMLGTTNSCSSLQCLLLLGGHDAWHYQQL
jgi:hypothetical protein